MSHIHVSRTVRWRRYDCNFSSKPFGLSNQPES